MSENREMSGIMINKAKIEGEYDFIDSPKGRVALVVAHTVTSRHKYRSENGSEKYIVNLKAIAVDQIGQVLEAFSESDEIPIENLNGLTLTGSLWVNNGVEPDHLPIKGEVVDCAIGWVKNSNDEDVLRITGMALRPAEQTAKVSFERLSSAYRVGEEAETVQQN